MQARHATLFLFFIAVACLSLFSASRYVSSVSSSAPDASNIPSQFDRNHLVEELSTRVEDITAALDAELHLLDSQLSEFKEPLDWNPYARDPDSFAKYQKMVEGMACDTPAEWCDSWYDSAETAQVQTEMWNMQHPANCSAVEWYRYYQRPGHPAHGIGSYIHVVSVAFTDAWMRGLSFMNHAWWIFGDPLPACRYASYECYVWPATPCKFEQMPKNVTTELWMRPDRLQIPEKWRHKGLFWWRAQVTKFLFRPRPSLLRYADNMRRETFPNGTIPHPLISLHIRHGDKAKEAGLIPVSAYMKMIEDAQLKEKYGARSIFLSTEDPESVDDLLREYNATWDIYYTKVPRFNLSPLGSMERIGPERETLISFSQLLLAVEADFFVGTRSSNWCRLIDELRKVNGKARTSYLTPAKDREHDW
jgi:hypothetical protein